ncbi:hypothetical protein MN086_05725 [Sulfurovum sp. XGS-02]|uniref:hypothetical protein n=1 Tax=Sulfurovum sp. XGS-02 TaxID=2925411 RepID=UPI00205078A4|nr:hypothetical protein [Sulfurovum sp. XGS-02]UPT76551.1 hypothetical protein MN086_05725 [Sulfurovum sp. XGS-02]
MKKFLYVFTTLCVVTANAEIYNIETKGNLESKYPTNCIEVKELTNTNTPADIFVGIAKCLEKSDYQKAGELYFTALAYGRFDAYRVKDQTAHQAIPVLRMNYLGNLNETDTNEFQLALKKVNGELNTICSALKELGKPAYYPNYMIQHGMRAFLGEQSKSALVDNFDSDKAWEDVLTNYVKCTK